MRRSFFACFIILSVVLSWGCTRTEHDGSDTSTGAPAAHPELVIGLIPERNVFRQMERYEPLAAYLSARTGAKIRLKVLLRYGNIIDNFVSEGLDGAFFGSFSYALAHTKLGVRVVARPLDLEGRSTYHGLIFVRKDSGIRSAADMRGKRFVFVDKATTAGYLLPLAYFQKQGIDYRRYLGETYFAGTHESAIMDVLEGRADIGAAKNTVFERPIGADLRSTKDLKVLERSPDVPENALAFRKDLDPALVEKIRAALLSMHEDQEGQEVLAAFGVRRFIATTENDYSAVYQYARDIGLDLATYDYVNE
jgi:phosphonate transport system substrate-binding protein